MEKDFPKMELDLGHVGEHSSFSFDENFEIEPVGGERAPCRVRVDVEITRTGARYLLEARVASIFRTGCGRCLETFECRIDTGFDIVFQGGEKVQIPDGAEEDDFIFLGSGEEYCFDLFPRIREAVLLDQPIRYLCSEDCRGICPGCGENLNVNECRCAKKGSDPRWGALKDVFDAPQAGSEESREREE